MEDGDAEPTECGDEKIQKAVDGRRQEKRRIEDVNVRDKHPGGQERVYIYEK